MLNEDLKEGNYWVKYNGQWVVGYYKVGGFFYPESIGLAPIYRLTQEFDEIGERIEKKIENGFYWAKDKNNQWRIVSVDNHLLNWFGRSEHSSLNIHKSTFTLGPKIEYKEINNERKSGFYWAVLPTFDRWQIVYYNNNYPSQIYHHSWGSVEKKPITAVLKWGDLIESPTATVTNDVIDGLYWGRPINSPNTWRPTLVENNQATLLGYTPWNLESVVLGNKIEPVI
jgi:hypothetical protein